MKWNVRENVPDCDAAAMTEPFRAWCRPCGKWKVGAELPAKLGPEFVPEAEIRKAFEKLSALDDGAPKPNPVSS